MPNSITAFFDAWGETDPGKQAAAIAAVYAADGSYADPRAPELLVGVEAIANYVAMFAANAPGWTAQVVKTDVTAGVTRATVAFGGKGPDGTEMVQHGQYVIDMDGDKITRAIGFVGIGAPE